MPSFRLPAEWEPQDAVLLAWPHEHSDWAPMLNAIEPVIAHIVAVITRYERVVLIVPTGKETHVKQFLRIKNALLSRIVYVPMRTNDIWTRDYGPITVYSGKKPVMLDFSFNGWGRKHAANLDNRATHTMHAGGSFPGAHHKTAAMVLEGGSIDSNSAGTIMTTAQCLREKRRNPLLSQTAIEKKLKTFLGARSILWLNHGGLEGDDTDSHIDTLARFAPGNTILYVQCGNPRDVHYEGLQAMESELKLYTTSRGTRYCLAGLPLPDPCFGRKNQRCPATYANFLVINNAVLVPTYGQKRNDQIALARISMAFPKRKIIGINCLPVIEQGGSLHCLTMQLPAGVLS